MSGEPPDPDTPTAAEATASPRQQMVLKITLYVDPPPPDDPGHRDLRRRPVSGTGTSTSRWGTSAYSFFGTVEWRLEAGKLQCPSLDLHGLRVSGFDCGEVRFTMVEAAAGETTGGHFAFDGHASYRDDHNEDLAVQVRVTALLNHGTLEQIHLRGQADGFTYAEFLAAGESVGGAEYS